MVDIIVFFFGRRRFRSSAEILFFLLVGIVDLEVVIRVVVDELGNFPEFGRADPSTLQQPVRVSADGPVVDDLEGLVGGDVLAPRNAEALQWGLAVGTPRRL